MQPLIFNCFKPAGMSSYDIIRLFKKHLPKSEIGKIGHFGTLDPFACGVLLIGISGGQKLNNFVHSELPKSYIAVGKLGIQHDTGDYTGTLIEQDRTRYFYDNISKLDANFIEEKLREKFLGDYWQSPHKFSAAKFEGKKLYEYARAGVEIKKEKKLRRIYSINVVKYQFPYLSIRFEVSSGTYIRSLFLDCANYLGTVATLISLVREKVGHLSINEAIKFKDLPRRDKPFDLHSFSLNPTDVLKFPRLLLDPHKEKLFSNGVRLRDEQVPGYSEDKYVWVCNNENSVLGLARCVDKQLQSEFIFSRSS